MELSSTNGFGFFRFIGESTGGANFNAGATEYTIRFLEGRGDSACIDFTIVINESQSSCLLQILAGPYTTQTADTEIVIEVDQWLIIYNRKVPGDIAADILFDANILGDLSQFAMVEYGTTAFLLRYTNGTLN